MIVKLKDGSGTLEWPLKWYGINKFNPVYVQFFDYITPVQDPNDVLKELIW